MSRKTARSVEAETAVEEAVAEPPKKMVKFDPSSLGLPADFLLTDYARLKGCSCKVPQAALIKMLRGVHHASGPEGGKQDDVSMMDCSIVPIRHRGAKGEELFLVSTTDFFTPSVEDPYVQGQVACANVISDLCAMGIYRCDTMLMILAVTIELDTEERYAVATQMVKGYVDWCTVAGTTLTGGQSVLSAWPFIGGVAMSTVSQEEMIHPTGLCEGDILVLTKPLGNQLAVNLKQWVTRPSPLYLSNIQGKMSVEDIEELYTEAVANMIDLNVNGAKLMHKYKAHGATDITGFGILGHATNFSEAQPSHDLCIEIHTLPILKHAIRANELIGDAKYKLLQGLSAETSGGLLVALAPSAVCGFMADLATTEYGARKSWVVGNVTKGKPATAKIAPFVKVLAV